jgi:hypothetical protein
VTTYPGRIEARLTVSTGGLTVSATNSGGGPTDCTVAAGNYYPTEFIAAFQAALNASRAPALGSWSVSISSTTGLVTIDCTSGETLTKSGGSGAAFDAGASSVQEIGDGWVEWTVDSIGTTRFIGLGNSDPDQDFASIDYAAYCDTATVRPYESGGPVAGTTAIVVGDVLRIVRSGTTVTWTKNGTVFHTSGTPASGNYRVDTSLLNAGSALKAIRLFDAGTQVALTWQNAVNVTASQTTYSVAWTSTSQRDLLGFTGALSSLNYAFTAPAQCRGVWIPDWPLQLDGDPEQAPTISDLRTSQSPTGVVLGLSGNTFYRHTGLVYSHVARDRVWESAATYDHASWEWFFRETQLGLESSLFTPASPLQIYWNNAGTLTLLGDAANDGAGTDGWTITGLGSVEPRPSQANYTGLFRIELGTVVSEG